MVGLAETATLRNLEVGTTQLFFYEQFTINKRIINRRIAGKR